MSGRADIFVLLAGEDVNADHVNLGVSVLAGLRRGHLNDLAGSLLNQHEAVLAQC